MNTQRSAEDLASIVLSEMESDDAKFMGGGDRNILLPSNLQPNQVAKLQFRMNDIPFNATVRGVHFFPGKVKYDLGLWLGDGSVDNPEYETRIYNVDSVFVTPA